MIITDMVHIDHAKGSRNIMFPSKKSSSALLRALAKVASWTMLSRILGFVRDILLARLLGAGPLADAFFVALKLPNFFRRLFAEGTLTVALVPVLAEERKKSEADAHAYLNALAGLLLLALLLFTLAGMIFMPWLLLLFAPGFHGEADRWQASLHLARWMFPYLACISLAAMSWAVLNSYRKFSVAAASPALLNIALIFAAIVLAPQMDNPAEALAIGVILGGVLQLAIQFPALKRIGWIPSPTWRPRSPAIWQTLLLFGPAVLSIAAVQINILVGTILATLQPVGAVSYLYYADRLVQLPLGVFGIAMGTALLPALSDHMANRRFSEARRELGQGLAWLTWIILPAVVGLLLLAEPIVRTLFEHGLFTANDAHATAMTLQAYTVGLMAFCWARVLSTACYAEKDAKAPMRYAIVSMIANIVLALLLMEPLGYVGLALATSLASWLNVVLLWRRFTCTQQCGIFDRDNIAHILRAFLASLGMAAFLLALYQWWAFPEQQKLWQCLWLSCAIIGGGATFFALSKILAIVQKKS
ncbi:MAG: murein biosynthesis integral membrane protein MurJ [Mariprofundaceae bacterium]|nr:murein biosynthesis integral membrane protein MurJ [Mariprofundaceae bacterium]